MDTLIQLLHYAASFLVIISVIVFIHEFGHYLIAKLCGVRVEAFSIGFGKELVGWNDRSGTRWKISLIPAGGYVKMFGDAGAASTPDANLENLSDAEKRVTFHYKPLWKKAAIVAGGPLSNFILTISILTFFILTNGLPSTEPLVGEVMPDTPAYEAGFEKGDRILSIGGENVQVFSDIPMKIATNLGTPIDIVLKRGDETLHKTITPQAFEDKDALGNAVTRPLIGFRSMEMKYEDTGLVRAVGEAVKRTYDICASTLTAIGQMITGKRDAKDLKGPLGIAKLSGQAAEKDVQTILWFIAMLSANLGLVNLLPVPLLDGGHLLFYGVEALRGRPLAVKIQEYGFRFGFAVLISLMAFSLFNDVRQLF